MRSIAALRTLFTVALLSVSAFAGIQTKTLEYEHAGTKLVGFLAWEVLRHTRIDYDVYRRLEKLEKNQ